MQNLKSCQLTTPKFCVLRVLLSPRRVELGGEHSPAIPNMAGPHKATTPFVQYKPTGASKQEFKNEAVLIATKFRAG